jgi:hypothetical protein
LSCLLNNHSKIVALGDTNPALKFINKGILCGCGLEIKECHFWKYIADRVNPNRDFRDGHLLPLYPKLIQNENTNRQVFRMLAFLSLYASPLVWRFAEKSIDRYVALYNMFYHQILNKSGADIFFDGQKELIKVIIFAHRISKNLRIRIFHLWRDPRGFVYSNLRRGRKLDIESICKYWLAYHKRILQLIENSSDILYFPIILEDLCKHPAATINSIFRILGIDNEDVLMPVKKNGKEHIIGNEMLKKFDGRIVYDQKWKYYLGKNEQRKIIEMTKSLLHKNYEH